MRTRLIALAVLCFALVAPPAFAGKANTSIKDVEVVPNANATAATYSGRITSPDKDCIKGRKIKIIHLSDPPFVIGETTTDKDGNWELNGPLPPAPTEEIKIKVKGSKHCKSKTLVDEVGNFVD
jgi:hypothetical protein